MMLTRHVADDLRKRIKWPDTLPDDEGVSDAGVTFTTIHQAKGLEYRKVRLVKGDDGSTPESVDALEEGRVLFVGMSRAKDDLAVLNFPSTRPFYLRPCADGRERWHRWIFKVTQFELGCSGDINEESILRTDLIGSAEIVKKTQDFLSANQAQLIGRGVTLVKEPVPGKSNRYFYKIMLDPDGKDARCLGYLHEFVTRDILGTRSTKKMWLPNNIHNLRISAVTTSVTNRDLHIKVPAPWRDSKFWLTVIVHGIGQYT